MKSYLCDLLTLRFLKITLEKVNIAPLRLRLGGIIIRIMIDFNKILLTLKQRRKEENKSQAELADLLHLTTSGYRKIENGQSPLSLDRFIKICAILGINPCQLMEGITDLSSKDLLQVENNRLTAEVDYLKEEIHYQRELNNKLLQLLNPKYIDLVVS